MPGQFSRLGNLQIVSGLSMCGLFLLLQLVPVDLMARRISARRGLYATYTSFELEGLVFTLQLA
jgi:hypothetical protein